ncbi:MAG TPA: RNA methyltransferase, partial [Fibrobacteria bacterium]|nr:RNA methyltransferase [Fibrobacteria bacterium]
FPVIDPSQFPDPADKYAFKLTEHRRALLKKVVDQRIRHFTLVLEDLKDPHNISAVIRTSEVFGFQDVHVISEVNPYRVGRSVLKGSYKWLDIYSYSKRARCLQGLKEKGYRIAVASTSAASVRLDEVDLGRPTAFYLGSETMGNHPDTLAAADIRFMIPQYGLTESMNVSVAAGVLVANLDRWLKDHGRENYSLSEPERAALLHAFYERSAVGVDRNSPIHFID